MELRAHVLRNDQFLLEEFLLVLGCVVYRLSVLVNILVFT